MRYSNRLLATLLLWLTLAAPALAQAIVPVQMGDANLATTNVQNFISTLSVFTAPRTLTVPARGALNAYYIQFVDTNNAVNGANTLTIRVADGSLINGSATYVVTLPGTYTLLTPSPTGYTASTVYLSAGSGNIPSGSAGGDLTGTYPNPTFNLTLPHTWSGQQTFVAPILGTPASGNLVNTTGYALGNLTGAGAGCLTWLATPSSANLRGCLTDETGTGVAYFVGGALGTPASGVATNLTGTAAGLTAGSFSAGSATNLTSGTLPAARTNGHMNGTATNDSAAAGEVGEVMSADLASGSAISLTTSTTANITSITLTAGDWDVYGTVVFTPAATTSQTRLISSLTTTSATIDAANPFNFSTISSAAQVTGGQNNQVTSGPRRFSVAGSQQVWVVAQAIFTVSTMTAYGSIRARRVR